MTIKTHEYVTTETFKELASKLKMNTREVRFGPLNAIPKNTDRYPKPWVGEVDERGERFKLFRVKGSDNTSDLSVQGEYIVRSGQSMISVRHKLHFTAVVGFAGLGIFVIAVFFLLAKKGIMVNPFLQTLICLIILLFYGYTFYRDLREDEKGIALLINKKLRELKGETKDDELTD